MKSSRFYFFVVSLVAAFSLSVGCTKCSQKKSETPAQEIKMPELKAEEIKELRIIDSKTGESKIQYSATSDISCIADEKMALCLVEEICKSIAKKYVEENYGKIVSLLNQQAIANLVVAQVGIEIASSLERVRR